MNEELAAEVITKVLEKGVREFCFCPGARNLPLYLLLKSLSNIKIYFWPEERSAAFFALGRVRSSNRAVAVITTSGTAVGELLPAAMEAFYTGDPLLLITADRPRIMRGTNAPQTAEQVGIFGVYTPFSQDIAFGENCSLENWDLRAPAHLNVCFEAPVVKSPSFIDLNILNNRFKPKLKGNENDLAKLDDFLQRIKRPLVIVSALKSSAKKSVINFLLKLNTPVYLEATSGLREEALLRDLSIYNPHDVFEDAAKHGYKIDGVIRIGGVPTHRLWRDLEESYKVPVISLSEQPFTGLSDGALIFTEIEEFLSSYIPPFFDSHHYLGWIESQKKYLERIKEKLIREPTSELGILHELSIFIPNGSKIYLGNSLPIREWDLAATREQKDFTIHASRGLNGIDGQISTFLGSVELGRENWAIIGDLTALYDLAGLWILPQLKEYVIRLVVINNCGGQIFTKFCNENDYLNSHDLDFSKISSFWNIHYNDWNRKSLNDLPLHAFIECKPDFESLKINQSQPVFCLRVI